VYQENKKRHVYLFSQALHNFHPELVTE